MAMYGRALTLLTEVHITLREDVGDINLMTLKDATPDPLVSDPTAVVRWVRLLEATSPALVNLGREIESIELFVKRRRKATVSIQKSMCTMGAIVTLLVAMSVWRMMTIGETVPVAIGVGMLVGCLLGFFAVVKTWVIMLVERLNKFDDLSNGPVMNMLRKYKLTLCDKFLVQYSAAMTTGSGMAELVESLKKGPDEEDNEETSNLDQCAKAGAKFNVGDCRWPVDPCVPLDSLPPLQDAVKRYCTPLMRDMLDRLQEIKLDIEQYDRPLLWRCVAEGVNQLRSIVYTQHDSSLGTSGLTRETALQMLSDEILPILRLPAVELRSFKVSDAAAGAMGMAEIQPSKSACWRSCIDDKDCKVALFDRKKGTCQRSELYAPIESFTYTDNVKASNLVMVRRPPSTSPKDNASIYVCGFATTAARARIDLLAPTSSDSRLWCSRKAECNVLADDHGWRMQPGENFQSFLASGAGAPSSGGSFACVKSNPDEIFNVGVKANIVNTLRDQSTAIATSLLIVLKKYRYQVDLDANRGFIDNALANYYGQTEYIDVAPVMDEIFLKLHDMIKVATGNKRTRYIEPERFAAKVAAMNSEEMASLLSSIARLQVCSKNHRDNFPPYRDNMMARMFNSLLWYSFLILGIVFIVYMITIYTAARDMDIDFVTMVRRVSVSACVLTIVVIIGETTVKKYGITRTHNHDSIDTNGEILVGNVMRTNRSLIALKDITENASDTGNASKLLPAAIVSQRDIQHVIEAYDRCNFITHSVAKMPFPTVEVVVYTIIALIFVTVAALAIARIGPMDKIDNVRRLLDASHRVKLGELTNMNEVMRLVECCQPPEVVWEMFVWFGIIMLFVITWWFLSSTHDTVDDYESAVAAMRVNE